MGAPVEWRAAAGAEIETEGHGLVDLGFRSGDWSAEIFTETLDLRYTRTWEHGKLSVGLRGSAFAQGMWITPWTNGAPDDTRKQQSWAIGPDLRAQRWLAHGLYLEGAGSLQRVGFKPFDGATLDEPDATWGRTEVTAGGYWHDGAETTRLTAGFDVWAPSIPPKPGVNFAPRLQLDLGYHPTADRNGLFPLAELRAGWATGQSDLVATRLGGLTPYNVPLAGAAWAEFWVQDYAAGRLGLVLHVSESQFGLLADGAVFTPPAVTSLPNPPVYNQALGFAATAGFKHKLYYGDLAVGVSPWLVRTNGWPLSVYFQFGSAWGRLTKG